MLRQSTGYYGLWSIMILDYMTHEPLKLFKSAAELLLPYESDMDDLVGGGMKMAEESDNKIYKSDMTMMLKHIDRETYALMSSAVVTIGAAEPSGYSSCTSTPPTAVYPATNNTISSATTGIANIVISNVADLKAGKYIIKAVTANTIYFMPTSDIEFGGAFTNGTQVAFGTNTLGSEIANSQLYVTGNTPFTFSVTSGAPTILTGFGLTLTGGSAVAMNPGDTAEIDVRPGNIENEVIVLGNAAKTVPKRFAMLATLDTKTTGEIITVIAPKVMPSGFALPLKQKAWAEISCKLKLLHYTSETEDYAVKILRSMRQPV